MRRALIVGIDDYHQTSLRGCVNDAKAIGAVLETNGTGSLNFGAGTRFLVSPPGQITRATLRKEITELFANECEIALLYFSGHGFVRSGEGWIVPKDAQQYDEGIAMTEILGLANTSPVKNKIIILDCCYSGNMGTPNTTGSRTAELSEGLTVLTASRGSEAAVEEEGRGGVFTNLVVAALEGGAADLRGHITPGSIYAYVDQALGAWDQRPIFKTNVTEFTSLREVEPQVPTETIRKIISYFPEPQAEHALDPTYEDQEEGHNPDNVKIFKDLQKLEGVGLVVPVDEEHMYFAAIHSKSCKLTKLGAHYWRLAKELKL